MKTKKDNKFVYLALFLFLSFFMSWWGGYITSYFKEPWYSTLIKPTFNPPDWIFAPVWISIYLLVGYSAWLMWSSKAKTQKILNHGKHDFWVCVVVVSIHIRTHRYIIYRRHSTT